MSKLKISTLLTYILPVFIAIALQTLSLAASATDPSKSLTFDSWAYLALSRSLVEEKGYGLDAGHYHDEYLKNAYPGFNGETPTRMRQPGYPLFLCMTYWFSGQNLWVTKIVQAILIWLAMVLVFDMAKRTFKKELWSGTPWLFALYFPLWLFVGYIGTETLFLFLLVVALYLFYRSLTTNNVTWMWIITGLAFSATMMTRPIILAVAVLCVLPCVFFLGLKKGMGRWAILSAAFILGCLPWTIRNSMVLNTFTPLSSEGGYTLWYANCADLDSASKEYSQGIGPGGFVWTQSADQRFKKLAIGHIKTDPIRYVVKSGKRFFRLWLLMDNSEFLGKSKYLFHCIQVCLSVFFLFGLTRLSSKEAVFYLLPVISITLMVVLIHEESRYKLPAIPFFLVVVGQGIKAMVEQIHLFMQRKSTPAQSFVRLKP